MTHAVRAGSFLHVPDFVSEPMRGKQLNIVLCLLACLDEGLFCSRSGALAHMNASPKKSVMRLVALCGSLWHPD